MEDQLITLETAELAKEKGFNIPTENVYIKNRHGYMFSDSRDWYLSDHWEERYLSMDDLYPQPTQSLLQKWLREEHRFHIHFNTTIDGKWYTNVHELKDRSGFLGGGGDPDDAVDTYEEALEKGLQEALKLIKR